jgi:protocatechuate 3,4-dioxygenase beta subunit
MALTPIPAHPPAPALTQADIDVEIRDQQDAYDKAVAGGAPVLHHPRRDYAPYRSSLLRHPKQPLVAVSGGDPETVELSGPVFGVTDITEHDSDLTVQHRGEPIGERMTVSGRLLDRDGRPVRGQLVEIWQANAAGRYAHLREQHPAPLDPHFTGVGRTLTDDQGRYSFTTINPGPYPWGNHTNAWRPAHIHFSVFGTAFTQRLVTQMYFPGDPLFPYDPIYNSVPDEEARQRMISSFDMENSISDWALAYRFDIVLRGREQTPFEEPHE